MIKMRKAFSLIEVVFVLTILGIVASISSQIIVQVYENYITQNALYKTTTKTEIAINQIVNRLTFAINGTTVTKDPDATSFSKASEGISWVQLKNIDIMIPSHNQFTTIEWIGYDNDGFSAGPAPYWSGLANYNSPTASSGAVDTPGSQLNIARDIITNLSDNKVALDGVGGTLPAIIFSGANFASGTEYDPACMGLINESNTSCISPVSMTSNTRLSFPNGRAKKIYERYKLAWSAYAFVPEASSRTGLFDLFLYSNYQPWNKENYKDGDKSLLIKNVSVFKFTENGGIIQLKLCATEHIGNDQNISSCKEKAIIQ